jgi:hypothetical protein
MPINWLTESIKWKLLINRIQPLNLVRSFKAVISGITIGIATPNRVGEIGGRILFIEKENRSYGIIATWIGSFSQFIITITTGVSGLILLLWFYPSLIYKSEFINKITLLLLLMFLGLIIWLFFNTKKIKTYLLRFPFLKSKLDQLNSLSDIPNSILIRILFLSFVRFTIFSFQYFLLLFFFNVEISMFDSLISISLVYLFTTLIPTTTLAELGIRGSLAIFIIGFFSQNIPGIVLASFTLWITNLALPAIIGSIFLIKNKF